MAEQWFLRDLRKELRLDQAHIERDTGLFPPRISELERGVGNPPTPEERQKIIKALVKRAAVRGLEILLLGRT
jgi:transcriptional regulator with XRE-family HTH domain